MTDHWRKTQIDSVFSLLRSYIQWIQYHHIVNIIDNNEIALDAGIAD